MLVFEYIRIQNTMLYVYDRTQRIMKGGMKKIMKENMMQIN